MGNFIFFILLFITFGHFIYYNNTITAKGTDKLYDEFQESTLKLIANYKYKCMHNSFHRVTCRESTSKNMLLEIVECTYMEIKWDPSGSKKLLFKFCMFYIYLQFHFIFLCRKCIYSPMCNGKR